MTINPTKPGLVAAASALAALAGGAAAITAHRRFANRLEALERCIADGQKPCEARTDLPLQVAALAERLGARGDRPTRSITLRQAGRMWFKPGARPLRFTARQRIGTSISGFVWLARIGPLGAVKVVDSFVAGRGYLEARLFGTFGVSHMAGTAAIDEGEALRYLAELPLNPDAILFDHGLAWSVEERTGAITVASGHGVARAEITFHLDKQGRVATAQAASRAFDAQGQRYPWHGRFWAYQDRGGRIVPLEAEVAWTINGAEFVYWRGTITDWKPDAAPPIRG